jgi:hypothetical protein
MLTSLGTHPTADPQRDVSLPLESPPLSWKTSKQRAVTLSTTEAENTAAADAAREAIWLRNLMTKLKLGQIQPPTI